jgi:hypothetical protein
VAWVSPKLRNIFQGLNLYFNRISLHFFKRPTMMILAKACENDEISEANTNMMCFLWKLMVPLGLNGMHMLHSPFILIL